MRALLRALLVRLCSCCCSCCCCACCGVPPESVDSEEGAHAVPLTKQCRPSSCLDATSLQTSGGDLPMLCDVHASPSGSSGKRHAHGGAGGGGSAGGGSKRNGAAAAGMTTFLRLPSAVKGGRMDESGGPQHSSQSPPSGEQSSRPSLGVCPDPSVAEELTTVVATAMQNSALRACFRANPNRVSVSALRKRGQQAWRRAMRAGGPFAPGSLVGAVAADNHRRSIGLVATVSTLPSPTSLPVSPSASLPAAPAIHPPPSLTRPSDGFQSARSLPTPASLAACSVRFLPQQHVGTAGMHEPTAGFEASAPGGAEVVNLSRLSRASQASQASNASSYFSVLSHDAQKAFASAGVRPIGGASGAQVNSHPHLHHHHHHHHPAVHVRLPRHAAAASSAEPHPEPHPDGGAAPELARSSAGTACSDIAEDEGDEDECGPFSHSTHPAVEAFRAGQLGLGFSGGGFLFPWHLGVVTELKDMGVIHNSSQLAGASCGAIIVSCVNSGMDLHGLVDKLLEFADDCRTHGTAGRLRYVIEHFMTKELPPDAHLRCSGRTHIQLTRVFPYLKVMSISEYHSKEDLVSAIATSSHIPAYNDGSLVARFRNGLYIDGGVLRHLPAPPRVAFSAGVSCVPLKFLNKLPGANRLSVLRHLAISPDLFQDFPYDWQQLASLVLVPGPDPVLLSMIEHGKRDARTWATATGLAAYLAGTLFIPASPRQFAATCRKARQYQQPKEQQHKTSKHRRLPSGLSGLNLESLSRGAEELSRGAFTSSAAAAGLLGSIMASVATQVASATAEGLGNLGQWGAGPAAPSPRSPGPPLELVVTGGEADGPVMWDPTENAYTANVRVGLVSAAATAAVEGAAGGEASEPAATQAVVGAEVAVEGMSLSAAQATAAAAAGVVATVQQQQQQQLGTAAQAAATPARVVTLRFKGQSGQPDTLVTLQLG